MGNKQSRKRHCKSDNTADTNTNTENKSASHPATASTQAPTSNAYVEDISVDKPDKNNLVQDEYDECVVEDVQHFLSNGNEAITTHINTPISNDDNISKLESSERNESMKKEAIKELMVNGYLRNIEIASWTIIPSDVVLLVLSFINLYHIDSLSNYFISISTREIIFIQIGQCGIQMGKQFWGTLCKEHNLDQTGKFSIDKQKSEQKRLKLDKIDVYFQEAGTLRYHPRAVEVDLEPGISDIIRAPPTNGLMKRDNICCGASGAGNNWAKGYYTEGAELIDEVLDIIRKETEYCGNLYGFQMAHSLGGGTGSGMGSLTLLKLRDYYPDKITSTFSVFPSPKVSDVVVEPYNAILCINELIENADETFVIDNEALYNMIHNTMKHCQPQYSDLNWIISMVMSGITAPLRFTIDPQYNNINLIPFPKLHFFLLSQAPLFSKGYGNNIKLTIGELTDQMWSCRNFISNINADNGKYFASLCIYRGYYLREKQVEIDKLLYDNRSDDFVSWTPNSITYSIVGIPQGEILINGISGTMIANTTAMKGLFERISDRFAKMYQRKAFLHWYKGEGMDEMEFQEADQNVRDLIDEYQRHNIEE